MIIQHYTDRAWGLIHTKARNEKKVRSVLAGCGIPVYLPCLYTPHSQYIISELPMFNGYLFAAWNDEERREIQCCSGVVDIIASQLNEDGEIIKQLRKLSRLEEISKKHEVNLKKDFSIKIQEPPVCINQGILKGLTGFWRNISGQKIFVVTLNVQGIPFEATIDSPAANA